MIREIPLPIPLSVVKVGNVRRSLKQKDYNCQIACPLVHFSTSALPFPLHFLEVGDHHTQKLDDDGRGDIRHHSQREDGSVAESAAGKHIQQTEEACGRLCLKLLKLGGVDTGHYDVAPEAIHKQEKKGVSQPFPQLFNLEDIFDCLYKSFHRPLFLLEYCCLAAESLDFLLGRLGECVSGDLELCSKLTVAENLHLVILGNETGCHECIEVNYRKTLLAQSLECGEIHGLVFHPGRVLESELGQTPLNRHLTALESDFVTITGAGLGTVHTAGRLSAVTGALAPADTFDILTGAFCRC